MLLQDLKEQLDDIGAEFFEPKEHFGVSIILSWQAVFTALMAGLAAWVQSTYGESATDAQIAMRDWLQWALFASFAGFIIAPWLHFFRYLAIHRQSNLRVGGLKIPKIESALRILRSEADEIDANDKAAVDSILGKQAELGQFVDRIKTSNEKNLPKFVRYKRVWNLAHMILTFLCMFIAHAGYMAFDAAKESEDLRGRSSEPMTLKFL